VQLVQFGAQDSLVKSDLNSERLSVAMQSAISQARMAHYDSLTGLPNRALLFDRLTHAMNQTRRYGQELAVLFIDLDRFKFVNDTMGHEAGDTVLKTVASRIRDCLRDSDTAARLGGDEFIVLVANLDHAVSAAPVANKIVESVSQPIMMGANAALRRIVLGVALQRAIRDNEFELHYQPQIDLKTGLAVGLEALVRWRHPERGLILPDQFIPLVAELGLMPPPPGQFDIRYSLHPDC
jgi:diguanylate cyclase (GGDEF)-like protein